MITTAARRVKPAVRAHLHDAHLRHQLLLRQPGKNRPYLRTGRKLKTVCIVQPYVPNYRVAFFEQLSESLCTLGIRVRVVAGSPDATQAKRGDAVKPEWLTTADHRVVTVRGRSLVLDTTRRHWQDCESIILPLMGSSVGTYEALLRSGSRSVGLWGHVAPYVSAGNRLDLALERWQMKHANRIFAYTTGGRSYATNCGVPEEKITVVNNSLDTSELERLREHVHPRQRDPYLVYIGGLDQSKRIDLIADSLQILHDRGISVRVKVAGRGPQADLLHAAVSRGQVEMVGYVAGEQKARLILESGGILVPGRVGLVAVEALAAARPILTTRHSRHAPEIEYLTEGLSMYSSLNAAQPYADLLARFVQDRPRTAPSPEHPRLEAMVKNFADGVIKLLNEAR